MTTSSTRREILKGGLAVAEELVNKKTPLEDNSQFPRKVMIA